jgi:phosphoadenosine phosphosulfate reductase
MFFHDFNSFWENKRMGSHMFISFKAWGKEGGLFNAKYEPLPTIKYLGNINNEAVLWAYIFNNIAYESHLFNWYVRTCEFGVKYSINDLLVMMGDDYSVTTRKNALSSLKETLRYSPIGSVLGQGEYELKGKSISSIKRYGWANPSPLAILYALYKYAEKSDHYYSFTLADLFDETTERKGISPVRLYNLSRESCKEILVDLARNYSRFIKINFNKDIMEDIYLSSEKTSLDVVSLF